jgi:hypothetical protein
MRAVEVKIVLYVILLVVIGLGLAWVATRRLIW